MLNLKHTHIHSQSATPPTATPASTYPTSAKKCKGAHRIPSNLSFWNATRLIKDGITYNSNCICEDGYFDDGVNLDCQPCVSNCAVCLFNATNCLKCRGTNRVAPNCTSCTNELYYPVSPSNSTSDCLCRFKGSKRRGTISIFQSPQPTATPYAVYSVRNVAAFRRPQVRVSRKSDQLQADIFNDFYGRFLRLKVLSTEIQYSSLSAAIQWLGESEAYLETWYDQGQFA